MNGHEVTSGFRVSSDSSWVVYRADQETDGLVELFVTYDAPPAPPTTPIYLPLIMRQ